MRVYEVLKIPKGITAVTGSGGKTTLLHVLAAELPGKVILCTTTRMFPSSVYPTLYDPTPDQIRTESARVFCVGSRTENGKLGHCASVTVEQLAGAADYVLVEADGSRGLPLKAHAPWEPVIPPGTRRVVCVTGASGFGRPAEQCVHRPQLWKMPDTSPASVAAMLLLDWAGVGENAGRSSRDGWDVVLVNQCDGPRQMEQARELAEAMKGRMVCAGSLRKGEIECLS